MRPDVIPSNAAPNLSFSNAVVQTELNQYSLAKDIFMHLSLAMDFPFFTDLTAAASHAFSDKYDPDGLDVRLYFKDGVQESVCFFDGNVMIYIYTNPGQNGMVSVAGANREEVVSSAKEIADLLTGEEPADDAVSVQFWYMTNTGPRALLRRLVVPRWTEIESNYPERLLPSVNELMAFRPEVSRLDPSGKLIIWQGSAGTGKTYALRALIKEWNPWCTFHYVTDPEKFFGTSAYMMNVLLSGEHPMVEGDDDDEKPWRLFIMEDAGELIKKDAKKDVGQGLSRLLNVVDGLVGQGLRIMIMITTNEEVGALHEAVERPGRCLAQIVYPSFTIPEANAWLADHDSVKTVKKPSTLSTLYEKLEHTKIASGEIEKIGVGFSLNKD